MRVPCRHFASIFDCREFDFPPVFILATVGAMAVMLGLLRRLDFGSSFAALWRIPLTYGRTPLFFYIAHFYLFALYPKLTADPDTPGLYARWSLSTTYAVWFGGLVVLYPPCVFYHRLRLRYPSVLRYF